MDLLPLEILMHIFSMLDDPSNLIHLPNSELILLWFQGRNPKARHCSLDTIRWYVRFKQVIERQRHIGEVEVWVPMPFWFNRHAFGLIIAFPEPWALYPTF